MALTRTDGPRHDPDIAARAARASPTNGRSRREEGVGVSILCQHHESPGVTMRQKDDDVDASKLLKMLQT